MARCIQECGTEAVIDGWNMTSGDDVVPILATMLAQSDDLAVLFTPASRGRARVWTEIGFMRLNQQRVVPIFHGITPKDLLELRPVAAVARDVLDRIEELVSNPATA